MRTCRWVGLRKQHRRPYLYSGFQMPLRPCNPIAFFVCMNPYSTATQASFIGGAVVQLMGPNGPLASDTKLVWVPSSWAAYGKWSGGGPSPVDFNDMKTFVPPSGVVLNSIVAIGGSDVVVSSSNGEDYSVSLSSGSGTMMAGTSDTGESGNGTAPLCMPVSG